MITLITLLGVGGRLVDNHAKFRGKIDHSQPSTYANGCHLGLGEFQPKPCFVNLKSEGPLIYLYGDSHAAQWVPALEIASQSINFKLRILTKSSCPFVSLNLNKNCNRWQKNVLQEISINKPSIVILASLTNAKYFSPLTDQSYSRLWMENFSETITFLNKKTHVVLIEDTPYSLFNTSQCLLIKTSSKCNFKNKESKLTKKIRSFSQNQSVDYLTLNKFFCNYEYCFASNNTFNYFYDNHHISVSLSKSLSTPLGDFLKPKIRPGIWEINAPTHTSTPQRSATALRYGSG